MSNTRNTHWGMSGWLRISLRHVLTKLFVLTHQMKGKKNGRQQTHPKDRKCSVTKTQPIDRKHTDMSFVSQEAPSVHSLQDFVYSLDVQATLSRAYSDEGCACCEWHWGLTIPAIVYFQWPRLACDALSFPDSPSSEQGWGVKVGVNRRDACLTVSCYCIWAAYNTECL